MSFIKEYFTLTKQYTDEYGQNTILLMQCGAFFEVYGLKDKNDIIYGSNICDFSKICDLNVVDKKVCVGNDNVVLSGFKDHLVDKYIKKLQDTGYTVVVYVQNDDMSNGQITRSLLGVFSPGTYFSVDTDNITNKTCCIWIQTRKKGLYSLLNSANTNSCTHIIYVGVALIDIYTGKSCIMEYFEQYIKNPTTFDELERFISIHCPSETIVISNLGKEDINDIVSYVNIKSKALHFVSLSDEKEQNELAVENKNIVRALNCEKQIYQTELLRKFYKFDDIGSFMTIFGVTVYATQAFCYLLDFIYQHNPNLVYKIAEPTIENESDKLVLANHSLKQLNIIDDDTYRGKYSSVVKMLNECITPMGKRKFTHSFLNPVTNVIYLQGEYDIVECLLTNMATDEYTIVKQMLSSFKDLVKINRQIMLKKIQPKYIYQLYMGILSSKMVYNFVLSNHKLTEYLEDKLGPDVFENLLVYIVEISTFLDKVLIMDMCKDIDNIHKIEQSFIKNGVDSVLDKKIMTLMESEDQLECCRAYFSSIIANYETGGKKKVTKKTVSSENDVESSINDTFVKIHETEKNNFSLIATDRRCKILEEVLSLNKAKTISLTYKSSYFKDERQFVLEIGKDVIVLEKQSATNRFITSPQINKLCKDVSSIKINLIDTVSKVYANIINDLERFQSKIEDICEFITCVDVVYAKTYIAFKYNYCKPTIENSSVGIPTIGLEKSYIKAHNLRHCLIEKIQQSELYVANDVTIGADETNGILLYGTNAVGKTSIIRALGISVVMAQSGLYVPASSFVYYPYKYIFTRILGNDNLFKGLSTFAVEMSELRTILRLADSRSLVLGDELCSGTESTSAISIFVAGVQTLYKKECSFIFATHLHEIVDYEEITSLTSVKCKHMSVIYDKETDALVYDRKLKDGPGNNMYGLEVCKSLSLPQDFLEMAYNIRMKYKPEAKSVLDRKQSHFNAKHIKGQCEKCGKHMATEVHHLQYQQDADGRGLIENAKDGLTFHKNHPANLISLCNTCHDEIHTTGTRLKKVKTSKGTVVKPLL
uniref:DNA mismatch repair proteins mutS family domain-containing protein n=1 Tax=viral metagenome TaxID=1070528 RepID=A0A6C0I686_9ZZZZ